MRSREDGAVHLTGGNGMLLTCWVTGIDVGKKGGRGILGSFKHAINRIIICLINLFIKLFFAQKLD